MGTSKGYIPPTTIHWTQAKRAVTSYLNDRDFASMEKAAHKYTLAMKNDIITSSPFISAVGKVLSFSSSAKNGGLNNALHDIGREDLIEKNADDVFDILLNEFTNYGSSTEDVLAAQAIGGALNILGIEDLTELSKLSTEEFMIEVLSEYLKYSFGFRYSEKISKGRTPAEAADILANMEQYISNKIHTNLDKNKLKIVDFQNLSIDRYVENALKDALDVFSDFYEEG